MREGHIEYLVCPDCVMDLSLSRVDRYEKESIEAGQLQCPGCKATYPINGHIPRFVPLVNYAGSFGFEWNKHAQTQYDSFTKTDISATRFFTETKWPRDLRGQNLLEVGSGSGRFTEVAAATGAMVVSMDYSYAVEANYRSNGYKENVLVVQGDIYRMPFKRNFFDKLLCIGVLQHTPDVKKSFLELPKFLKPGGKLTIDVYRYNWWRYLLVTRYWVRAFTKRIAPEKLYSYCENYINFMWPLARKINKLPNGRYINKALLIADYRGKYPLTAELLKEWAILDTFDGLSPAYDNPQPLWKIRKWFEEAGLEDIEVHYGFNGIEGRGTKPAERLYG